MSIAKVAVSIDDKQLKKIDYYVKKKVFKNRSQAFQISVPKKIREQLHIKPGQQYVFIPKGDCLELVPKRNIKDMRGILEGVNTKNIRDRDERV